LLWRFAPSQVNINMFGIRGTRIMSPLSQRWERGWG
jgi:hypothetical protein